MDGLGAIGWTVLAPVTERGEVIGVLELEVPDRPRPEDTTEIASLAHLLAFVVIANRWHTELSSGDDAAVRSACPPRSSSVSFQAPHTCEAGAFTLSGWLGPAADIAGDTFDYSLPGDTLHVSITDAMGHGVGAALTATLCVGALRGARRAGSSLPEQAVHTNHAAAEHSLSSDNEDFVTGLLGRLDLRTACCTWSTPGTCRRTSLAAPR